MNSLQRINHTDINCEFFTFERNFCEPAREVYKSEKSLRTLIKGIGDYLMRVVGSVPTDLGITMQVYDKVISATFGPLYYEGQGPRVYQ